MIFDRTWPVRLSLVVGGKIRCDAVDLTAVPAQGLVLFTLAQIVEPFIAGHIAPGRGTQAA
jgi:hypothetical protein